MTWGLFEILKNTNFYKFVFKFFSGLTINILVIMFLSRFKPMIYSVDYNIPFWEIQFSFRVIALWTWKSKLTCFLLSEIQGEITQKQGQNWEIGHLHDLGNCLGFPMSYRSCFCDKSLMRRRFWKTSGVQTEKCRRFFQFYFFTEKLSYRPNLVTTQKL